MKTLTNNPRLIAKTLTVLSIIIMGVMVAIDCITNGTTI